MEIYIKKIIQMILKLKKKYRPMFLKEQVDVEWWDLIQLSIKSNRNNL